MEPCKELIAGEVGYFTASIKDVKDTRVGDTITGAERPAAEALPGYRPARPMVYCGIYTEDGSEYPDLRDALKSSSSTTPPSPLSRNPPPPWASASAAAFWGCSTWRSFRNGWSGSSIWTL